MLSVCVEVGRIMTFSSVLSGLGHVAVLICLYHSELPYAAQSSFRNVSRYFRLPTLTLLIGNYLDLFVFCSSMCQMFL